MTAHPDTMSENANIEDATSDPKAQGDPSGGPGLGGHLVRQPSFERGCENKMRLSLSESPHLKAQEFAKKHGKDFGVYRCRFCDLYHITSKLEKQAGYAPLVYQTEFFKENTQTHPSPKEDQPEP